VGEIAFRAEGVSRELRRHESRGHLRRGKPNSPPKRVSKLSLGTRRTPCSRSRNWDILHRMRTVSHAMRISEGSRVAICNRATRARVVTSTYLSLIFSIVAFAADSGFHSGLSGKLTIGETEWFTDGGSVSAKILDEHGSMASVFYKSNMFGRNPGGELTFCAPDSAKAIRTTKGTAADIEVRSLIDVACINTFGTANPKALRKASRAPDGTIRDPKRARMASLLLQLDHRKTPRTPKQTRK